MLELNPKECLLNDIDSLEVLPDEDLVLVLEFNQDMSGAVHNLIIEEHKWPYRSSQNYVFPKQTRSSFDLTEEATGKIKHSFTVAEVNLMKDRRLTLKWQVAKDGRTWIAAERELYVGHRD